MKNGEKGILVVMAVAVLGAMAYKSLSIFENTEPDKGIPFFTTASPEMEKQAGTLMRNLNCRDCHKYYGSFAVSNLVQNVPAPPLDGIGVIRSEQWFYNYFSAKDPQSILPSRLKKQFQMPSFAGLSEKERHLLASYMASLQVKDWYLEETKKTEYEKLTGKPYTP
jgi:sulfur-oxidizing protein SoxX